MYGCSCILLIIGSQTQRQSLMIPYLVMQMLVIVLIAIVGIPVASVLFYLKHPGYGIGVSTIVIISSILPIFFWWVVKKAYKCLDEGGNLETEKDLECG